MRAVAEVLTDQVDESGTLHIGSEKTKGCPHCGHVDVHTHEAEGHTVLAWWHAGAECCPDRLAEQIKWRRQEIDTLEAELDTARRRPNELRRQAEFATYKSQATQLAAEADKADRNMRQVEAAYEDRIKALLDEQSRLARRHAQLRGAA